VSLLADLRSIPRRVEARRKRRAAERAATDEDHQRVMRAVVDEVAAEVLASGAAELTVQLEDASGWTGPTLLLEPRNPAAARVELGASVEATFLIVGRRQLQQELWDLLPEARGRDLRNCLEAVIDGRVEATAESHWSGTRSTLRFDTSPDPVISRRYSIVIDEDEDEPFWHESYEPY
jgi:hypothetical protein